MSFQELNSSLFTGFIDHKSISNPDFWPNLLTNDPPTGKKVLSELIHELENCDEYWIFVAFITTSGVATLINTLEKLEKKGVKGHILASTYLNFTDPEAIKRIQRFSHIEVKISSNKAFHSKGFLFRKNEIYRLIVGSSNLTQTALATNKEWNLKVSATSESALIRQTLNEFKQEFKIANLPTTSFMEQYALQWKYQREINRIEKRVRSLEELKAENIKPNKMQLEALQNLKQLRENGEKKALIISATGTGKTYLSAFDVKEFKAKTLLFVVHRLNIAEAALKSFKSIMPNISMGIYSGAQRELDSDYLFTTVQTLSRKEHLEKFNSDQFEYIIFDETHRAAAESYQSIFRHFSPKFLLGMTATPERTDGSDIFKIFDHNIAYEIRLNQALQEEMLAPFHYFGVSDLTINGELIEDKYQFNLLVAEERVRNIIEKSEFYNSDNGIIRALVFCRRTEDAKELAKLFNSKGRKSISLTGEDNEESRKSAFVEIQKDEPTINYIFAVDILNEGIDIPKINQIILLRPTESAIIFVQQLGRGLRLAENKEYLTVIDFIGNYNNNYLLPIALYGDNSYNKDNLRKLLSNKSSFIPGASTVNFEEIAEKRIFESLNNANLSPYKQLKEEYTLLKNRLNRIPTMVDFVKFNMRDPWAFIESKDSYYSFVDSIEKFNDNSVNQSLLKAFALNINNSKRVEEAFILLKIIDQEKISLDLIQSDFINSYERAIDSETLKSCVRNLNFQFIRQNLQIIEFSNNEFSQGKDLQTFISSETAKSYLYDNIEYAILSYNKKYLPENFVNGFIRYEKYSRKDVCRILNWTEDLTATLFGYRTREKVTPCFVTYNKATDLEGDINYNDHFINKELFAWDSRSNRRLDSDEIQNVIHSKRILLFVKKEDSEGTEFYYMGDVSIEPGSIKQGQMRTTGAPVVHFHFKLDQPVETNLYNYITN